MNLKEQEHINQINISECEMSERRTMRESRCEDQSKYKNYKICLGLRLKNTRNNYFVVF